MDTGEADPSAGIVGITGYHFDEPSDPMAGGRLGRFWQHPLAWMRRIMISSSP
jgi:hypothetical protein